MNSVECTMKIYPIRRTQPYLDHQRGHRSPKNNPAKHTYTGSHNCQTGNRQDIADLRYLIPV